METSVDLNDPDFWNERADYRGLVHDFTTYYSQQAWDRAQLSAGSRVLDIAAGSGALACIAALAGARVLATDFSPAMVESIKDRGIRGLEAAVMDGQALDLPDASFDAAFSMFGIMLFSDWRRGLSEMARVLRPGGLACVGTWKSRAGAAANLLLAETVERLFPQIEHPEPVTGLVEFSEPHRFKAALQEAGLEEFNLHEITSDFVVDRAMLTEPDRLAQFSPVWPVLDDMQKAQVIEELVGQAQNNGGTISVPSPAWIAFSRRGA